MANALEYLVGEKLLRFVETAEHNPLFAQELPSFVAEINRVFSLADVGNYPLRIEHTKRAYDHSRDLIDIRANPLGWLKAGFWICHWPIRLGAPVDRIRCAEISLPVSLKRLIRDGILAGIGERTGERL